MLRITDLSVFIQDQKILDHCSLTLQSNQVHILMGPNGSGKSSLVSTIMGYPLYAILNGKILLFDEDITTMPVHLRANKGIFLGMQHSIEIEGLLVLHFLKEIYSLREKRVISIDELLMIVNPLLNLVGLSESILQRYVNVGFSGGEKKRFELLQMLLLKPQVVLLDELDSGVDIDGLKQLAHALCWYREQNPLVTILLVTHYRRILEYIKPDFVHVMIDGKIVVTGDSQIVDQLEQQGYEFYAKRSE